MPTDKNNWQRMRFKKNKVWVALDSNDHPLSKEGKVLIKYQLDQDYEYWVYKKNIQAIEDAPINASKKTTATPSKTTSRKHLQSDQPIDCEDCICLFTDGASSGNPGPSGIGILMRYKTHKKKISRYIGLATNNIAELEAIRVGLEEIKNKSLPVRVFTDSAYALGLLSKGWKPKKNQELVAKIRLLMDQFKDLDFIKVKGHTGHPDNECADQLATSAISANM